MADNAPNYQAIIRAARPEDVEAVGEIAKRAWAPIFAERGAVMGEDLMRRERGGEAGETKAREVCRFCEAYPDWALVAEVAGEVVAFITFVPHAESGIVEIGNNAVDPEWQGHGLGTAQYEHVLSWARGNGFVYAKVTTGLDDCHAAARTAYERAGFDIAIPHVTYYQRL